MRTRTIALFVGAVAFVAAASVELVTIDNRSTRPMRMSVRLRTGESLGERTIAPNACAWFVGWKSLRSGDQALIIDEVTEHDRTERFAIYLTGPLVRFSTAIVATDDGVGNGDICF